MILQHGVGGWIRRISFEGLEGVGERAEGSGMRLGLIGDG